MIDIKKERTKRQLTQAQLAEMVGVSRSTIANLEAGRIRPSVEVAKRLGGALSVPWSALY